MAKKSIFQMMGEKPAKEKIKEEEKATPKQFGILRCNFCGSVLGTYSGLAINNISEAYVRANVAVRKNGGGPPLAGEDLSDEFRCPRCAGIPKGLLGIQAMINRAMGKTK